jgi:molybdate transport system ATP-binding protein
LPAAHQTAQAWLDRFGVGDRVASRVINPAGRLASPSPNLANDLRVLLLDEPFSGLDVRSPRDCGSSSPGASYDGVTLLVTHHAIDALTADVVWVLEGGGPCRSAPARIAARPLTAHVARLVGLNAHGGGRFCRSAERRHGLARGLTGRLGTGRGR